MLKKISFTLILTKDIRKRYTTYFVTVIMQIMTIVIPFRYVVTYFLQLGMSAEKIYSN